MKMPVQKPGKSKQDYGTPWELIRAVEARWGKLTIDLAAHDNGDNAKAPEWVGESQNYLLGTLNVGLDDLCWCNPPFDDIGSWAAKWRADAAEGAPIISLVPASIGAGWFKRYVCGGGTVPDAARVVALEGRIPFQGCHTMKDGVPKCGGDEFCDGCSPYPKDCMLLLWGLQSDAALPHFPFEVWSWREQVAA